MPDDTTLRCDCGYAVIAPDEAGLVEEIRVHAEEAHGIVFSVEDALVVLLRSQLDLSRAPAERSVPDGPAPKGGSYEDGPFSANALHLPKGELR